MDTSPIDATISALSAPRRGRPDLPPGGKLALRLLHLQRDTLGRLDADPASLDAADAVGRLAVGNPALAFSDLHVDPETYHCVWMRALELCSDEGTLTSEDVAELRSEGESGERLMRLTQPWYVQTASESISARSDLTPEMIGIAVKPWLLAGAMRAAPVIVRAQWLQRVCPTCGGEPDLALMHRDGQRSLLCSRCDTLWQWKPVGCPFCDSGGPAVEYHVGRTPGYCLQECRRCRRGLRTVDESVLGEDLVPAAERMFAAHLDHLVAELNLTT